MAMYQIRFIGAEEEGGYIYELGPWKLYSPTKHDTGIMEIIVKNEQTGDYCQPFHSSYLIPFCCEKENWTIVAQFPSHMEVIDGPTLGDCRKFNKAYKNWYEAAFNESDTEGYEEPDPLFAIFKLMQPLRQAAIIADLIYESALHHNIVGSKERVKFVYPLFQIWKNAEKHHNVKLHWWAQRKGYDEPFQLANRVGYCIDNGLEDVLQAAWQWAWTDAQWKSEL